MSGPLQTRIVIVNYNGAAYVGAAIESALAQSVPCRVIVADNASQDDSVDMIAAHFPQVEIVRNLTNAGFGSGANLGARGCDEEYIAFLNPDAIASSRWIERMTAWMAERRVDLASSVVLAGPGEPPFFAGGRWLPSLGAAVAGRPKFGDATDWISGCAFVARTDAFERLGGFDQAFFLYFEDVDLSLRAHKAQMKVAVLQESLVQHAAHGTSTGQLGARRKQCIAYGSKGRLIRRHVSGPSFASAIAFQAFVSPAVNGVSPRDYASVLHAFFNGALTGKAYCAK